MPEEQASEVGILFNDFLFYWGHSTDTWQYPCTISMGQHWRWDGLLKHSVGSSHLKQQGVRIVRRIIEKQASSGQNKQESLLETGIWPTPSDWASTAIAAWKWPAETLCKIPQRKVEWNEFASLCMEMGKAGRISDLFFHSSLFCNNIQSPSSLTRAKNA